MEFWGTEVPPGEPQLCYPGGEMYCHMSQAALGPASNGTSERVVLRVETGGKSIVLGTLSSGKCDQMALDLIFDREFKLSHTGASSSVYFCGYKTEKGDPEDSVSGEDEDEDSEEEEVPEAVPLKVNGNAKPEAPVKAAEVRRKAAKSPGNAKVVDDEGNEGDESDEDEGEEDEEDDSDVEDSDELEEDEDKAESEDEDLSEDVDVATPEDSKKRPLKGAETKTSVNGNKKARVDTPVKPGPLDKMVDNSAAAAATPAKKAQPTPESKKTNDGKDFNEAKKGQKTPQKTLWKGDAVKARNVSKSPSAKAEATSTPGTGKKGLGPHKCVACNRSFATEAAHNQHISAKHGTPACGK
ncbi:hypothetical protein R1flu_008235 [Riccia fluitans]|uniref:C2H2-type domain-containing protein n=1 Tax=Riccia fluitans TaxID=41844 RepID=A0ABD1YBS1_9MARC